MVTARRRKWGARLLAGMLLAGTTALSGCFYHHGHRGHGGAPRGGWYGYDDHRDRHGDRDRDRRWDRDDDRRWDRDRDGDRHRDRRRR